MSGSRVPNEPPPSYQQATGSSSTAAGPSTSSSSHNDNSHLNVPGTGKNGIPATARRSMEDEGRPLPEGWVRTYDPKTNHQFFVDTTKEPPKSIWHHPYDDDDYLAALPAEERERIEQESMNRHKNPSKEDIIGAHSDDDEDEHHAQAAGSSSAALPPRPEGKGKQADNRTFGRKFKDKVTGTTHEERVEERRQRAEAEQRMYEQHLKIRQAMQKAMQTGQPQLLGKDRDGRDVYIEPPPPVPQGAYGGYPGGMGYSSYSPYNSGIYTTPNARYIRPQGPYQRGGYGYGGGGYGYGAPYRSGFGAPMAIGGGLLGGLLLGDLLF